MVSCMHILTWRSATCRDAWAIFSTPFSRRVLFSASSARCLASSDLYSEMSSR